MQNNTAKIIPFVKRELPPMPVSVPGKTRELNYVYIVYLIDEVKKTKEVVHVCSRYDFAMTYMEDRMGSVYGQTYEAEGWPLDWYEQIG